MTLLLLILGIVALYYGAEWLVDGSSRIALALRISPLVIGLTVVAFGTSAPEMVIGALAAWREETDMALGNVVGSNIANLGLILGLGALVRIVPCDRAIFRRDVPVMLLSSVLVYLLATNGAITRLWGAMLFGSLLGFTAIALRRARAADASDVTLEDLGVETRPHPRAGLGRHALQTIAGLVALMVGAKWLVDGAQEMARYFGVPEFVIAASVVAIGTSLPELATSIVAAVRGEADVLVGNIVGSNIFNVLGGLGLAAAITPVPVAPTVLEFSFPVMLAISAYGAFAMYTGRRLTRAEGAVLLVAYLAYIVALFR